MKDKFLNFCEKLEIKKYLKQPSFVEFEKYGFENEG